MMPPPTTGQARQGTLSPRYGSIQSWKPLPTDTSTPPFDYNDCDTPTPPLVQRTLLFRVGEARSGSYFEKLVLPRGKTGHGKSERLPQNMDRFQSLSRRQFVCGSGAALLAGSAAPSLRASGD